ncbi:hypothetical protein J0910_30695 [Nocardiopsis sp. CNT-189]|uniref:hypothetical protein n=1 Tax=Nocardiopsis oceanisediminis TaxID=2816862 RepID=UPI003B3888AF
MPGAGKTSLLGRLLGKEAVVFPDAQPDPAASWPAVGGPLAEARRAVEDPRERERFTEWFDPGFLDAYAAFWEDPASWAPPGAAVHVVDGTGAATEAVADTAGITPAPFTGPPGAVLACTRACGAPRSPAVGVGRTRMQLTARSLHRADGTTKTACLRRAAAVAACWL